MTAHTRFTINRGIVILHHKQPFLDWLKSTDAELDDLTLADLEIDDDAFLIPGNESHDPVDGELDAIKWVEKRRQMFFEHCLNEWLTDETLWPQRRSLKMFREWFAVEYRSMVWDLANEPLVLEDWKNGNDYEDEILH
jgi:hypothetical protein